MIKVNGDELDWREGMTVQDVLDEKKFSFPLVSVWINGEPVQRRGEYAITPVPDGVEIEVIHMMSGG
ncbi:MAG: sulfur carrier protein ThiS [Synergistaceae bacterium]|jgi:sulfur carrier protein|nr:sulfur carrier protein ThiS [Synergistaceae bacterium]